MVRVSLQDAVVRRAGVTARQWAFETKDIECGQNGNKIELYFQMSSKGGGTTAVLIHIGSQGFATLARAMCESDRRAAMTTFASELARETTQQSQQDIVLVRDARNSIVDLAQKKVWEAPQDDNHVQKLIWNGVKKLIEELSPKEKTKIKVV